jgi:hypothetical protein
VSAPPPGSLLARLDAGWTRLELALTVGVTASLVVTLVAWVALKGLAAKTTDTFFAGLVLRALAAMVLVGALTARRSRSKALTGALVLLAGLSAWAWRDAGADYFANILGWLQDGSLLTWLGGVRGLGTRLTLWLALLGASLATATGRHVSIDVATRAFDAETRARLGRLGGLVAALVCLACASGFFDFIAVDAFRAPPSASPREKAALVTRGVSRHAQLALRQLELDGSMLGRVLRGQPWDRTLTGAEWNAWLERTGDDELKTLAERDPSATRPPLLTAPGAPARGLLVKDLNLIIPWGLVMLALRFLLWALRGGPQEPAHAEGPA